MFTETDVEKVMQAANAERSAEFPFGLAPEGKSYVPFVNDELDLIGTSIPTFAIMEARCRRFGVTDPAHIAYALAVTAFNLGRVYGYQEGERYGSWAARSEMRRALGIEEAFLRLQAAQRTEDRG